MSVERLSTRNDQPTVVRRGEGSIFSTRPKVAPTQNGPTSNTQGVVPYTNFLRKSRNPVVIFKGLIRFLLLAFVALLISSIFDKTGTAHHILISLLGIAWNLVFFAILGVILLPALKKKMSAQNIAELKTLAEKLQKNAKKPTYND